MLHLILGPVHSGKSRYLQSMITEQLKENKEIYYIIPEQLSYETEKSFLDAFDVSDVNRIHIMTFTKLCETITATIGGLQAPILDEGQKYVYVMMTLQNLAGELTFYKRSSKSLSFARSICDVVDELKRSCITPSEIHSIIPLLNSSNLPNKLHDIQLIYETYDAFLENRFIDQNDRILFCARLLSKTNLFEGKTVFFDAFDGFMPNQHALLEAIMMQAEHLYISLPCDGELYLENDLSIFANVRAEARYLLNNAHKLHIEAAEPVVLKQTDYNYPELSRLERVISETSEEIFTESAPHISLVQAAQVYDELDFIAFEIKRLIAKQGYRFRDFAIVARNCSDYVGTLESVAAKYAMPVFFDQTHNLLDTPLFRLLIAACSAAEQINSEAVFNMLKSGLLPFTVEEISDLENYCYIWDIDKQDWMKKWLKNPSGLEKPDTETQGKLDRLNQLRERLVKILQNLQKNFGNTITQNTKALYHFIFDNRIPEALRHLCDQLKKQNALEKAQMQMTAYDKIIGIFDKLIACDDDRTISKDIYIELLFACAQGEGIGTVPHHLDSVIFCSSDRARVTNAKIVFMLGVNQGEQPRLGHTDSLLSNQDRQAMISVGLKLHDDLITKAIDEKFKFYASACAASERVYFCYSLSDFSMQTLEPSNIIGELEIMFPECSRIVYSAMQNTNFTDMFDLQPAFEKMLLHGVKDNDEAQAAYSYFLHMPQFTARMQRLQNACTGEFALSPSIAKALYGNRLNISATQIDTFHKCQFAYFCRYGMGVKAVQKAELDAAHRGTLIHYFLEQFIKRHKKDYASLDDTQISEEVEQISNRYLKEFGLSEANLNAQLRYLFSNSKDQIFIMIRDIIDELKNSDFEPVACELQIGRNGDIPAFDVSFSGGVISVSGIVDRVDTANVDGENYVRIIDYKTNSKKFRLNDLIYGLNMQMLLYLYAIVKNLPYKIGGVLYKPAKLSLTETTESSPGSTPTIKSSGLILQNANVIRAMDSSGKYISVTIKGDKVKEQGTATTKGFENIFHAIEATLKLMGESLHAGKAAAQPLRNDKLPCEYCAYRTVCLNEGEQNSRVVTSRKDDDALAELGKKGDQNGF